METKAQFTFVPAQSLGLLRFGMTVVQAKQALEEMCPRDAPFQVAPDEDGDSTIKIASLEMSLIFSQEDNFRLSSIELPIRLVQMDGRALPEESTALVERFEEKGIEMGEPVVHTEMDSKTWFSEDTSVIFFFDDDVPTMSIGPKFGPDDQVLWPD